MYGIPAVLMAAVGIVGAALHIKLLLFVGMPVAFVLGIGVAYGLNKLQTR
jgi:hypothetical protein